MSHQLISESDILCQIIVSFRLRREPHQYDVIIHKINTMQGIKSRSGLLNIWWTKKESVGGFRSLIKLSFGRKEWRKQSYTETCLQTPLVGDQEWTVMNSDREICNESTHNQWDNTIHAIHSKRCGALWDIQSNSPNNQLVWTFTWTFQSYTYFQSEKNTYTFSQCIVFHSILL